MLTFCAAKIKMDTCATVAKTLVLHYTDKHWLIIQKLKAFLLHDKVALDGTKEDIHHLDCHYCQLCFLLKSDGTVKCT